MSSRKSLSIRGGCHCHPGSARLQGLAVWNHQARFPEQEVLGLTLPSHDVSRPCKVQPTCQKALPIRQCHPAAAQRGWPVESLTLVHRSKNFLAFLSASRWRFIDSNSVRREFGVNGKSQLDCHAWHVYGV